MQAGQGCELPVFDIGPEPALLKRYGLPTPIRIDERGERRLVREAVLKRVCGSQG